MSDPATVKIAQAPVPVKMTRKEIKQISEAQAYISLLEERIGGLEGEVKMLEEVDRQIVIIPAQTPVIHEANIKSLHATMYPLSSPHHFNDDDALKFNKVIIISKREHDKEYQWAGQSLFLDDGAFVEGQAAKVWFVRIGWIKYDLNEMIPLIYSMCTVKDVQEILDLVINTNALQSLREEVLGRLVLDMQNDFKKFQDRIATADDFMEKAERREELLRKKVRTDLVRLDNTIEQAIDHGLIRMKGWQVFLLGLGWLGFLTILGLFLGGK